MRVILWGATGQAIVLRELLEARGHVVVALFDNNVSIASPFNDIPLYHGVTGLQRWLADPASQLGTVRALAAIGGSRGEDRVAIAELLMSYGIEMTVAVHPTAFVSADVKLGAGTQIMASAVVGARSSVAEAVIVNSGSIVEHECVLGRGAHVGPGAVLAGCVELDEYAFIGAGAIVLPRIRIGANSVVGAGSVVTRNVRAGTTVVGNPAREHPPDGVRL